MLGGTGGNKMYSYQKLGKVVRVMRVKEDTDLMIMTAEGKIIRIECAAIRRACA